MTFPMLRLWTLTPAPDKQWEQARRWIAAAVGLFLVPMILVTGSRAGVALGMLGFFMAFMVSPKADWSRGKGWMRTGLRILMWVAPIVVFAAVLLLGRAIAIQRLASDWVETEDRLNKLPLMLRILEHVFPVGTGYGSFDPVFRHYEPDSMLEPLYFNHAHNDLLELALTGGIPALLVLAAFLFWWLRQSFRSRAPLESDPAQRLAFMRTGAAMILLVLVASLVDYPLRTPLMAVVFTIACAWIAEDRGRGKRPLQSVAA
jgi:O-antigen ligase